MVYRKVRVRLGKRNVQKNPVKKKSCDFEKNQRWNVPFGKESDWEIEQFLKESPSQQKTLKNRAAECDMWPCKWPIDACDLVL